MTDSETVTAQTAVEMILSNRAANEPGFLERVVLDPAGTVAEIAAQVADTDDVDLSGVAINVHVQTPNSMHLVLDVNPESEVAGFAFGRSSALGFDVRPPVLAGTAGGTVEQNTTTDTGCHTNACKSKKAGSCPKQEFRLG